jgi:hypothetical protein
MKKETCKRLAVSEAIKVYFQDVYFMEKVYEILFPHVHMYVTVNAI